MIYNYTLNEYRTIDGTGNNAADYGAAHVELIRIAQSDYADGISAPAGDDRPSARAISNAIFNEPVTTPEPKGMSDLFWSWGQFVDHDITLSAEGHSEAFNIEVPTGDPYFDPFGTGMAEIRLTRSGFAEGTGEDSPREQVNEITAFIDASMVYGSDAEREAALRDVGGKLKVSDGDLLPYNTEGLSNANGGPVPAEHLFLAGDVRANETAALTSYHTLFVREHNRLVDEIAAQRPDYSDEQLYQEAKAIVEAQVQIITYNEFLPLLVGENAMEEYSGYKADVDPSITNMFATAAYRVGHTMLSSDLQRLNEDGTETEEGNLLLRDAFFNPYNIEEGGIDSVFRGLGDSQARMIDSKIVDDVRNFLFGPPGAGGFDLVSLNIQRGRDHGLASYNDAREAYGLERVTDFSDITYDVGLQLTLEDLYGSVDNIDPWVGGLVEDRVPGAMVGEFFQAVLVDQFTRLRDGDRFWYEERFSDEVIEQLEQVTLSDIIERNTDVEHMQSKVFYAYNRMGGTEFSEKMSGTTGSDLMTGALGDDRLYGNGGDDELYGDAGNDRLYGSFGNDLMDGGDGDDYFKAGFGNDKAHGGAGNDRIYGDLGNDQLYGDDGNDWMHGNDGEDELHGGAGQDRLLGGYKNDILNGGDDDDRLYGQSQDDIVNGDAGTDTLYGNDGDDTLNGGEDGDRLFGNGGNDVINGDGGNDYMKGSGGDDVMNGGAGNDRGYGGYGFDTMSGGEGNDYLQGNSGDDTLYGDGGGDRLYGGYMNDTIYGGDGDDYLYGQSHNDTLYGDAGNDYLNGGNGDDIMNGGLGNDILDGSSGNDIFVFTGSNIGNDTLRNFDENTDLIDLSDYGTDFGSLTIADSSDGAVITIMGVTGSILVDGDDPSELSAGHFIF